VAARAFAKPRFRLREPLSALFLAAMMIPGQATIVTKFTPTPVNILFTIEIYKV
jgi:ABC-type glycerol-3-phosphate transport system permease component